MWRSSAFAALFLVLVSTPTSLSAQAVLTEEGLTVKASYVAASFGSNDSSRERKDLQLATEVRTAVRHYAKKLPEWWGVEFVVEISDFNIQANRGANRKENGNTLFTFQNGRVFDFDMAIDGDTELITGVVAHEMNHVFFAQLFRQPLPRVIDEGAAQCVETDRYKRQALRMLVELTAHGELFSFEEILFRFDYPSNAHSSREETERRNTIFYFQSYFVVSKLIERGGKELFIKFVRNGCEYNDFERSFSENYNCTPKEFSDECLLTLRRLSGRDGDIRYLSLSQ